jgi:N-methylhydantoinase B
LSIRTGGGGGYGQPDARERDLVASDLADGYITEAAARDLYGYRPLSVPSPRSGEG